MKCLTKSAEDRIKEAAIKVFLEKGFDGTTTRDIAKEAGLNSALMNYYFRSKEKLFSSVFEEMLQLFFKGLLEVLNRPISLKEKISAVIDHDFEMFKTNPDLANFIINELHRNPDRFFSVISFDKVLVHSVFAQQLKVAVDNEEIRKIKMEHVLLLIKSNIQFIFQGKVMTCKIWNMNDKQFDEFAENHKIIIKDMITQYLFSSEK